MIFLVSYLSAIIALTLAVPSVVFAVEICAALRIGRLDSLAPVPRDFPIAILVPAHDEAKSLRGTLDDIKLQMRTGDRLIVVVDNCADDTASIAASGGAEVTVRSDPARIGKGYALDWGLNYLAADPPAIVVMIDADCRLGDGALDRLSGVCEQSQRPVQALYLMTASEVSKVNHQVAEFAWRVKNVVRPLGLKALGLPCQLMGTGMAFPWAAIRSVELSSGFIVEDLKLGLDLAGAGHAPVFCPSAVVTSTFPNSADGAMQQRRRWEQGHLALALSSALPLLGRAVRRGDVNSLTLALDVLVPPLSLFLAILAAASVTTLIAALAGASAFGAVIAAGSLVMVVAMVALAWASRGRDVLPAKSLVLLPSYLAAKARLYVAAVLGHRIALWVRADRN